MNQGNTNFLTNKELIAQLSLRDDLSPLEHQLLDRLILATDEVDRLESENTVLRVPDASGDAPVQP